MVFEGANGMLGGILTVDAGRDKLEVDLLFRHVGFQGVLRVQMVCSDTQEKFNADSPYTVHSTRSWGCIFIEKLCMYNEWRGGGGR